MNYEQASSAGLRADEMIAQANVPTDAGENDIYLKIEGVEGETQVAGHKGEIEVAFFDFFEWQQGSSGSGGGSGASRPTFENIRLTCRASKAGPKLFLACCKGDRFATAVLAFRKSGGGQQDFLIFKLADVVVRTYCQRLDEAGDGTAAIHDVILLDYAKIEVEYKPQNPDGSLGSPLKFDFDLRGK